MEKVIKIIIIGLVLSVVWDVTPASGQSIEFNHDEEIYKQINSMESGKWDFSPDLWYKLFHRKYSGASGSGFNVSKSNTGQIMPTRVSESGLESVRLSDVKKQEASIEEVLKNELAAEADRMIDIHYGKYQKEFARIQSIISNGLLYCSHASAGKADEEVAKLAEVNELLCEQIAYYHRTGPEFQLENAKREIAYEKALDRMNTLKNQVIILVKLIKTVYDK